MKLGFAPLHPDLGIRSSLLRWLDDGPELAFRATSPAAARAWQRRARAALEASIGAPLPRVPLRPRVLEVKRLDGYTRTMLTLDTAPRVKALCWLCVPDGVLVRGNPRGRVPAMIATPGHGIGAKDLLALDARGKPRKEGDGYQKDYALQCVRLGYPTLVVEPLAFGERRDADHMTGRRSGKPIAESGCHIAYALATMLGTTLVRLRMNDLQRALDYLETVPGIDPGRIGLMGISGGGQMTLWTAAADPRFKAAIVSGYMNRMRDSILGVHHCICNFVPSLARNFDMTDLGALVAPAMLVQGGTEDSIFPLAATRAAIATLRRTYRVFGVEDRFEADVFKGGHSWSPRKVEGFLKKWLSGDRSNGCHGLQAVSVSCKAVVSSVQEEDAA